MKEQPFGRTEAKQSQEKIEGGIWRPGIFEDHKDKIGAGGTTKELKEIVGRPKARLRVTGQRDRFRVGFGEQSREMRIDKLGAGRTLIKLLAEIDPEAKARDIQKTALVHGDAISVIDKAYLEKSLDERANILADGLITNLPHVPLVVSAADCAPVGIYDKKHGAIGAFHAGWRGTLKEVAVKGLLKMHEHYGTQAEDVLVVIGPRADKENYEVDDSVKQMFVEAKDERGEAQYHQDQINSLFKENVENPGRYFLDFGLAVKLSLEKAGVPSEQIEMSAYSTIKDRRHFTSERVEGNKARDTDLMILSLK